MILVDNILLPSILKQSGGIISPRKNVHVCVWLWWKEIFNDIAWPILSVCQLIARLWKMVGVLIDKQWEDDTGSTAAADVPWLCCYLSAACTVCCILTRIRQIDCAIDTHTAHHIYIAPSVWIRGTNLGGLRDVFRRGQNWSIYKVNWIHISMFLRRGKENKSYVPIVSELQLL